MSGRVTILTGPPGAGKSTVARLIAEGAEPPGGVHLHGDDFMAYIRAGFIEPWKVEAAAQNMTIARALSAACFSYAEGGYLTVLDWIVGPWFLHVYQADARRTGLRLDYVMLRPTEGQASQRARGRAANPIADYAPMRPLYAQLANLGDLERCVIETSSLTVDETLAAIRSQLSTDRHRLA